MDNVGNFSIRPMEKIEQNFSFTPYKRKASEIGLIGHLRGYWDSAVVKKQEFLLTAWDDHTPGLKTDEFVAEFGNVIKSLRSKGNFLFNCGTLSSYCYTNKATAFNDGLNHYGVRVDSEKYSYLMRLNPEKGEYNLYCYCYDRDLLNKALTAERNKSLANKIDDAMTRQAAQAHPSLTQPDIGRGIE